MSVALRSSPLEDSIPYKTVIRSRQPKDRKPELPPSYWRRPVAGGCIGMTVTGQCCQQVVRFGSDPLCYFHAKIKAGLLNALPGSLYVTNGPVEHMPPKRRRPRRTAGND